MVDDTNLTVMSGLSGFAKGLVAGMKYREELRLKREQMESLNEYRQASIQAMRSRESRAEKKYEAEYGEKGFKEQELAIKQKAALSKLGAAGLKSDINVFGAQTRIDEAIARNRKDSDKANSDVVKIVTTIRGSLGTDKKEKEFDKLIGDLRTYAVDSPDEQKLTSTINQLTTLGVDAGNTDSILNMWDNIEERKSEVTKLQSQWNELEKRKTKKQKEKEANFSSILNQAPITREKFENDFKFLLSVEPENPQSMRSALALINTYPVEHREKLAAELSKSIMFKKETFGLERPAEEVPFPSTEKAQEETKKGQERKEIKDKLNRGARNREAIKEGIKGTFKTIGEQLNTKRDYMDSRSTLKRYRDNRG